MAKTEPYSIQVDSIQGVQYVFLQKKIENNFRKQRCFHFSRNNKKTEITISRKSLFLNLGQTVTRTAALRFCDKVFTVSDLELNTSDHMINFISGTPWNTSTRKSHCE